MAYIGHLERLRRYFQLSAGNFSRENETFVYFEKVN